MVSAITFLNPIMFSSHHFQMSASSPVESERDNPFAIDSLGLTDDVEEKESNELSKQNSENSTSRFSSLNNRLEFELDERMDNRLVVKVIDGETEKVIRQYPTEKALALMDRTARFEAEAAELDILI